MSDQPEHTIAANYFIYWVQRAQTAERKHTEALAEIELQRITIADTMSDLAKVEAKIERSKYPGDPYNDPDYDEVAILKGEIERLKAERPNRYWEGRWRDEKADNERLRAAIEWLMKQPWKSIDKDNMEYQATVSCYVRDALLAALEPKP